MFSSHANATSSSLRSTLFDETWPTGSQRSISGPDHDLGKATQSSPLRNLEICMVPVDIWTPDIRRNFVRFY